MSRILIADDHPLNRQLLTTLLSYHGHVVVEAADGLEALDAAAIERPDLFIIDVSMPRMDGLAFVRALHENPTLRDIPVIFYTASYREEESRAMARAAGVDYVITKPSEPEVVLEAVARALGKAPAEIPVEPEQLRRYIERLQATGMNMGALIELSLDLHGESDPDRVMRTGCRAIRTIFRSAFVIATVIQRGQPTSWVDGPLDADRIGELRDVITSLEMRSPRQGFTPDDPLVAAIAGVAPGIPSALLVPMADRRDRDGWILVAGMNPWSSNEERLAVAAAGVIYSASENLRLRAELEQREAAQRHRVEEALRRSQEDLAAVFESSPVAIASFDMDGILRTWNPASEQVFGWRADEVIGGPNPAIPPGRESEFAQRMRQSIGGTTLTYETERLRKDGRRIDVRASLAPLRDNHGATRGFVGIALDITEQNQKDSELHASRERLRALSARVLSIQEEERTRIARELHDDLGQLLTAIKIDTSRLLQDTGAGMKPPDRVVRGVMPMIDLTLDTLSRIVSELRPTRIGEMGLVRAIEKKLAEFQERTAIECEFAVHPEELHIADDVATAVFRILEEALTNIVRHSGAKHCDVQLHRKNGELFLNVHDNGRGIRDAERLDREAYGLIGMKERAWLLGGSVSITGIRGKGTLVTARIPIGTT